MAAPFGHSVPSLCGLRGSPSMLTMRPSFTWMRVAHPTEQKGQMLGTDLASLIRSSCACARAGASEAPSPTSPPIAVPAPAPAVTRRKSRRLTCIGISPPWSVGRNTSAYVERILADDIKTLTACRKAARRTDGVVALALNLGTGEERRGMADLPTVT